MTNECVLDSIVESINKRKAPDFSKCLDSRPTEIFKPGDIVAGIWYNDPKWYAGKLELTDGGLAIPIYNHDAMGRMVDADHFIKICSKRK
jgi:hypothetical protein